MISKEDVKKLANLSRISVSDEELESIPGEISAILDYVSQIDKAVSSGAPAVTYPLKNVMREDANAHESGVHTEAILNEAPKREGEYVKVKKILG